jgi:hypothetical protein
MDIAVVGAHVEARNVRDTVFDLDRVVRVGSFVGGRGRVDVACRGRKEDVPSGRVLAVPDRATVFNLEPADSHRTRRGIAVGSNGFDGSGVERGLGRGEPRLNVERLVSEQAVVDTHPARVREDHDLRVVARLGRAVVVAVGRKPLGCGAHGPKVVVLAAVVDVVSVREPLGVAEQPEPVTNARARLQGVLEALVLDRGRERVGHAERVASEPNDELVIVDVVAGGD